ncbi:MAG TPA: hypothetical protein VID76_01780 [Solirubrobacterales bacterium]|jgi:hypothetical protein
MGDGQRRIQSQVLAILAAVALLGAVVVGYANDTFLDADEFAKRATVALDDDAVAAEIATRVTDDIVLNAQGDLVAVRPLIESVVGGLVGGSVFQELFAHGVRDVHRAIFQHDKNTVALTLGDIGAVLKGAFQALKPSISKDIPLNIDIDVIKIEPPAWVADLARVADNVALVEILLLLITLVLIGLALYVSRDRRRTVLQLGVAVVIAGVLAVVALSAARALVLTQFDEQGLRDAVDGIWRAFLGDLTKTLYLFAACGAVVAAAASSLLRPVDIFAPLRDGVELIARVPQATWKRVARALVLITVGVLIVLRRDVFVDLVVILVGLYVAYAGVSELMRLILPTQAAEADADRAEGRRALIATGVAAAVIVVGGGLFITTGGIREAPAAIETEGCNGSDALCDQPLDRVAFPSTHNAMSAVTNPDWLFGQQDAGFADQLHDGIRGLFIDAHYGTPTEGGQIKTDLSKLDGPEREAYVEELGSEALNAALRIRDRVVNSPETGPRAVYLCHRFCELGAIPILEAFRQYRDFLAANPDEVLAIVIEDYVSPADIDEAVRKSGLIDFVYTGPLEPPLPTLQEIIDTGGRAIMLSENKDGGAAVPWYHRAYDSLLQETPYSFKTVGELTKPSKLTASCVANRGPADAPLFLVNHWVDTSPAPKPSNAAQVNAREALLRRVHHCERQRDLLANLISVDFYRQGDLFKAVEELNAERTQP